jgi:hypothetical protein
MQFGELLHRLFNVSPTSNGVCARNYWLGKQRFGLIVTMPDPHPRGMSAASDPSPGKNV